MSSFSNWSLNYIPGYMNINNINLYNNCYEISTRFTLKLKLNKLWVGTIAFPILQGRILEYIQAE